MTTSRQLSRKRGALLRDKNRCHYCRCELTLDTMTLDHKRPRSLGGKSIVANLVAACQACNSAKADRPYAAFKTRGVAAPRPKPAPTSWFPDDTTREYA